MTRPSPASKFTLVGGGIASLAAAVYLIRDGHVPGPNVRIVEEERLGGSLDAAGDAALGFSMRGSRMYGPAYVLMYELLSRIPSLDDPSKSVTQDTLEFWVQAPWHDQARLVEHGHVVDAEAFGLSNKDRADLIELMVRPEDALGARRVDECFDAHFFATNFWLMWRSMFGFEPWHSASELRRYLLRFLRLFPDLASLKIIQSTRYNGRDSIVRPIVRWLEQQGVAFDLGTQVTDLDLAPLADGRQAVRRIRARRDGASADLDVGDGDAVIVTLGSMTADSTLGSMTTPPPTPQPRSGAWALWQRLAAKSPAFGRPAAFCGDVARTQWVTFTVTHADDRFVRRVERFAGSPAGQGGLVTLKDSSWGLTFHLFHPPAYAGQPPGTHVWWGYGLFADTEGDFVPKTMPQCGAARRRELRPVPAAVHDEPVHATRAGRPPAGDATRVREPGVRRPVRRDPRRRRVHRRVLDPLGRARRRGAARRAEPAAAHVPGARAPECADRRDQADPAIAAGKPSGDGAG